MKATDDLTRRVTLVLIIVLIAGACAAGVVAQMLPRFGGKMIYWGNAVMRVEEPVQEVDRIRLRADQNYTAAVFVLYVDPDTAPETLSVEWELRADDGTIVARDEFDLDGPALRARGRLPPLELTEFRSDAAANMSMWLESESSGRHPDIEVFIFNGHSRRLEVAAAAVAMGFSALVLLIVVWIRRRSWLFSSARDETKLSVAEEST